MTQADRLLAYLRSHPGATGLEIVTNLAIPKYTGRISDLRAAGYVIDCRKGPDRLDRYYVRVAESVTTGESMGMGLL